MKSLLKLSFVLLASILLAWPAGAENRVLVDSTQAKVVITSRPARIVTLIPSLGELVADLLGTELDRLIGVSEYSDYPPTLIQKSSIGPYHQFNLEKVVALKPDLVLASLDGNPQDRVQHLRELGLPVLVVATQSFDEIEASMKLVGLALGFEKSGKQMAEKFHRGLEEIRAKNKTHSPRRVLFQVGADPLVVVGPNTFLNRVLELLGAKNIYASSENLAHYPQPSLEDVIQRDPEVIIVGALGKDLLPYQKMRKKWLEFPKLKAVRDHEVHILQCDSLLRPSLRLLEGISQLSQILDGKKPSR